MPLYEYKYENLKRKNTSKVTGAVTYDSTPYFQIHLEVGLADPALNRRVKPTDLFANGTARSVYKRVSEDRRYIRPPSVSPDWTILQPAHYDMSYAWHASADTTDLTVIHSKLRAKIKSQNVNLAQNVAEYRQASSMFAGLASDVVKTFRSLRSGRAFADFVRSLQSPRSSKELAIANRWLQYQYGVKPLMSDLYGTCDALATKIRTGMFLHVRAKDTSGLFWKETSSDGMPVFKRWTKEVRGVARYKISDPSMKMLSQFGISNPLLLAWELIPYSFVVDWMFPVGNFLSSLDALNGTSDLRVITARSEEHFVNRVNSYGDGGENAFKGFRYIREAPVSNLLLPKLGYKPSKSLTAVLNGLALITQLRRR